VARLRSWARVLLDRCGFVGVGSLDFMLDGDSAYLLGGLPRLATGFELWERVSGTSALDWQLATYFDGAPPTVSAQAEAVGVGFRLLAEDPLLQIPQPGVIQELEGPESWQVAGAVGEIAWNYEAGQEVSIEGSKLLASGTAVASVGPIGAGAGNTIEKAPRSREQAFERALLLARGMLDELWIAGSLKTNQAFLGELLRHPWVREGLFHASFVDEDFLLPVDLEAAWLALFAGVVATIPPEAPGANAGSPAGGRVLVPDVGRETQAASETDFIYWVNNRPIRSPAGVVRWREGPRLWVPGSSASESVARRETLRVGVSGWIALEDGRKTRVCAYPQQSARWRVRIGDWTLVVRRLPAPPAAPSGLRFEAAPKPAPLLKALASGRVHALLYREGALVPAHRPLVWLASMRSLVPHALPRDFRVAKWLVTAGERVEEGQALAELDSAL
jgi:acetyl/propionyl-CoA carboxylase alpha subunit